MIGMCYSDSSYTADSQCSTGISTEHDRGYLSEKNFRAATEPKLQLRLCYDSGPDTPDSSESLASQWPQREYSPHFQVVTTDPSDLGPLLGQSTNDVNIHAFPREMLASSYDRSSTWNPTNPYTTSSPSYASSTSSAQSNFYGQSAYTSKVQQQNLPSLTTLSLPGKTAALYTTGYAPRSDYGYGPGICPSSASPDVLMPRGSNGPYSYATYNSPYTIKSPYDQATLSEPFGSYYPHGQSWSQTVPNPYNSGYVGSDNASISGRRRRGNLPKHITDILRAWFHDHLDHPYPTDEDKQMFIERTGLTISQISNWFINARRRQWPALKAQRLPRPVTHNTRHSSASMP